MKLVKSLLLGSAAGIVAVGSAVAADLPVRKAAPVDYVQVCSAFGTGFFYIPGTDTCLKVGGLVRWQGEFTDTAWQPAGVVGATTDANPTITAVAGAAGIGRNQAVFTNTSRYDLNVDARTATEFGTLRSYARLRNGGINQAFVQFAGITAGLAPNQFTAGGTASYAGFGGLRGATNVEQIAYTADLGTFSATIGVQNGTNTQSAFAQPNYNDGSTVRGYGVTRNASRMPDLVGNVKASFGDINVQLSGALTELRTWQRDADNSFASSSTGFALLGSVSGDLTAISPSTSFRVTGGYAEGALWYINPLAGGGRYTLNYQDAYLVRAAGATSDSVRKTKAWNIYGQLSHGWAPNVSQTLYGVYGEVTVPTSVRRQFNAGDAAFNLATDPTSSTYWGLGTNIAWTPVTGLTIGADVNYSQVKAANRVLVRGQANTNTAVYSSKSDEWRATLRILRSF